MKSEIFSEKVDGMICPQCEDEIARKITHRRGILTCRASYRKSCEKYVFWQSMTPILSLPMK